MFFLHGTNFTSKIHYYQATVYTALSQMPITILYPLLVI